MPRIGENEILIKVSYTSVNDADIKTRLGNKGKGNFPLIFGLDVAGVIEEVPHNSNFSKGERVIYFPKNGSYVNIGRKFPNFIGRLQHIPHS
ncbi:alcohol dehydrogenase catalytic domain-containing protein [Paenibacillus popilliae]|uniref:alcohol dehydrogenase catalytic domain-containing protein n=1 Tax=Paenibacillus popilliae TaxID=78057 RepID=UPI002277295F|nr:alcohol dehydrogenase catalytic domain-containing protein [Paenibacillus popilliae]